MRKKKLITLGAEIKMSYVDPSHISCAALNCSPPQPRVALQNFVRDVIDRSRCAILILTALVI